MSSSLSQGLVPGLLGEFYTGRRSGILHFTRGEERRSVSLHQGRIVNANTNVEEDRLGEILVRRGVLTRSDLDAALEIAFQQGTRLGHVLQQLGILDADRLDDALAAHVRQVLGKVFSWSDGAYAFEEGDDPAGSPLRNLPTPQVILEAARQLEDPDVVRYALGDVDRVLAARPGADGRDLSLTASEGYVLSRVDGTCTAREVIKLVPLSPDETRRTLLGLLAAGIVECGPVRGKVPASAGAPAAAAPPVPRPAPASPPPAPPELVSALRHRAEVPPRPAAAPYDPIDDALVAERAIRKADRLMADEKFWDAIQVLKGAIPQIHGRVMKDKAQVLLARAYLKNPNWVHRAEEILHKIVSESPQNGEAFFVLGTAYEAQGLRGRAEAMYRKTLEVRPLHRDAAARLKAIAGTPLLKKLFGRS
jgi:hypothetical protein